MFQAWDQVKAIAGDFEGKAGVVHHFDKESGKATVKFDDLDSPQLVAAEELQKLG